MVPVYYSWGCWVKVGVSPWPHIPSRQWPCPENMAALRPELRRAEWPWGILSPQGSMTMLVLNPSGANKIQFYVPWITWTTPHLEPVRSVAKSQPSLPHGASGGTLGLDKTSVSVAGSLSALSLWSGVLDSVFRPSWDNSRHMNLMQLLSILGVVLCVANISERELLLGATCD
jgi:hypothetical protein